MEFMPLEVHRGSIVNVYQTHMQCCGSLLPVTHWSIEQYKSNDLGSRGWVICGIWAINSVGEREFSMRNSEGDLIDSRTF